MSEPLSDRLAQADAVAAERAGNFPPTDEPEPCHGCGRADGAVVQCAVRWAMTRKRAADGAGHAAAHVTHHWLCGACLAQARAPRLVYPWRGVGSALAACGSGLGASLLLGGLIARSDAELRWSLWSLAWAPLLVLIAGLLLAWHARRPPLPGVLGELDVRPFVCDGVDRVVTAGGEGEPVLDREVDPRLNLDSTPG
jgi:hypothetical protein